MWALILLACECISGCLALSAVVTLCVSVCRRVCRWCWDALDWNVSELTSGGFREDTMLGKDYMLAIIIVNYDGRCMDAFALSPPLCSASPLSPLLCSAGWSGQSKQKKSFPSSTGLFTCSLMDFNYRCCVILDPPGCLKTLLLRHLVRWK